jgi:hypothetical protein
VKSNSNMLFKNWHRSGSYKKYYSNIFSIQNGMTYNKEKSSIFYAKGNQTPIPRTVILLNHTKIFFSHHFSIQSIEVM